MGKEDCFDSYAHQIDRKRNCKLIITVSYCIVLNFDGAKLWQIYEMSVLNYFHCIVFQCT